MSLRRKSKACCQAQFLEDVKGSRDERPGVAGRALRAVVTRRSGNDAGKEEGRERWSENSSAE